MTDDHAEEPSGLWARETAPQSPYTMSQVILGLIVLAIGAVITFVLPLLG